jgi:hypothetical protein
MLHARDDYNRIQDPAGRIPHNEPVLLIRAQDMIAADVCRDYIVRAERANYPRDLVRLVDIQAKRMDQWPVKKVADLYGPKVKSSAITNPIKIVAFKNRKDPSLGFVAIELQSGTLLDFTSLEPWRASEDWERELPANVLLAIATVYYVREEKDATR